ncbi:hypothetical protein J4444_00480 [Candidatus Woesearchaeota archaeon]|nr:hypothetical protein [Candidatus Woesearchaeota archaeon]
MRISFFEEFPTFTNLQKLKLVTWPTKLYVAAKSLEEFEEIVAKVRKSTKHKLVTEIIYWPILEKKDGYWVSPWTNSQSLNNLFHSLLHIKNKKYLSVMLDLEPPKEKMQIFTRMPIMLINKRKIQRFLHHAPQHNIKVYTVELSHLSQKLLQIAGLSYSSQKFKQQRIGMYYTSFIRPLLPKHLVEERFTHKVKGCAQEKMLLGIGLIAPGVYKIEPTYDAEALSMELKIAQANGIKEVIIFRLGGLDRKFVKVITKYL